MWTQTVVAEHLTPVVLLPESSTPTCTTISIQHDHKQIILINTYFKYADDILPYIHHIDTLITRHNNRNTIICADANAKSILWHNAVTDERGEHLEDLIMARSLFVFKWPGELSTFENTKGHRSNINVTLGTNATDRWVTVSYTHLI